MITVLVRSIAWTLNSHLRISTGKQAALCPTTLHLPTLTTSINPLVNLPTPIIINSPARSYVNTLNKSGSNSRSMNIDSLKKQSSAIQSYSAAVKRAADAPQVLSICRSMRHWFQSKEPSASLSFASGKRSNESKKKNNEAKSVCEKTTITATSAGFYFNHSKVDCVSFLIDFNCEFSTSIVNFQPSPDPRYPCQNQV